MPDAASPDLLAALRAMPPGLAPAEPPAAALAAEAWREAWRPPRVRLLLLAESHMATSAAELALTPLPSPGWPRPAGFVRHLYCPAYGEPALLPAGAAAAGPANAGTPQYWRLLAGLAGCPMPGRAALPDLAARLAAKAALLRGLRARGIWLTDASLVALAGPGGARAAPRLQALALRASWHRYHAARLPALAPAHVVVIGRGVAAVLGPALDAAFPGRWQAVPQPMGARGAGPAAALQAALTLAASRFAPEGGDGRCRD
ncbi:hypothetical protein [Roseicella frigidaeris]|uniref:Uncharacterized protein n=1 Tax=Roseicella frigidaeris TaxID=2230885 RepID=A0A327M521_9PROT|nr:hypothetical protein [Roseicella frigidaeris]RAI57515.1 hypothetical protein DOO78_18165 [Roseicella frigidaeris]